MNINTAKIIRISNKKSYRYVESYAKCEHAIFVTHYYDQIIKIPYVESYMAAILRCGPA